MTAQLDPIKPDVIGRLTLENIAVESLVLMSSPNVQKLQRTSSDFQVN